MLCSVRLPSTDKRPPLRVKGATMSRHLKGQLANHSRKRKKGEIMLPTAQRSTASDTELADSDPRVALIKQMLQSPVIKSTYPDALSDLHKVIRVSECAMKLQFATGYCHNHQGAHTSNRTYFFVIPGRVTQHCYYDYCYGYKNVMQVDTPNGLFV